MGPPLFMLIAYPSSSWNTSKPKAAPAASRKRTVLYFHWITKEPMMRHTQVKGKRKSKLAMRSEVHSLYFIRDGRQIVEKQEGNSLGGLRHPSI